MIIVLLNMCFHREERKSWFFFFFFVWKKKNRKRIGVVDLSNKEALIIY